MKKLLLFVLLSGSYSSFGAWYKGNTHAHTILSGHGDATPDEVANWYHDHGYNFLVLSEHNKFIDPTTVKIKDQREDFVLVPGVELTGAKNIHTTALNVKVAVPWKTKSNKASQILKEHVKRIHSHGGEAISNHPNYEWALSVKDIFAVKELKLFELYNGHPHVNVAGKGHRPSTEEMWDELLSLGKKIFAVSSDDAHNFHKHSHELSNPGRGWIMVESDSLAAESLVKAMTDANFYASNGVMLTNVKRGSTYQIEIDLERTM
ncbi:MAG TPA: CehA/McbA family metallohydrolase [Bacteriovoracaceae bacterium]|nr:CehA/McbA family metallohydrolase [Bacteriovoracaceae bacterium]